MTTKKNSQNSNPERAISDYKLPTINKSNARVEPNIGNNMEPNFDRRSDSNLPVQRKQGFERFRIYERQQKPFDIINCYPKEYESNKLRNFPKLTLENQLIEKGAYHTFN